jgi:hypothetical protein
MARTINYKGQFWSFDIIFAIVIFGVAITVLTYTWFNISTQLAISYGGSGSLLQLQAQALSTNLLSTGSPSDWQSLVAINNVSSWSSVSIGIASAQKSTAISPSKLYAFIDMANTNYSSTKQLLGIGYDYYITITGGSYNITIGQNPSAHQALTVYVVTSGSSIGSTPVIVRTMLWTNKALSID